MAKEAQTPTIPDKDEPVETTGGRKKPLVIGGVVLAVMLIEGAGVFLLARYVGGSPQTAAAAGVEGINEQEGQKAPKDTELEVVKVRAQNERSQQLMVYEMTVAAVVSEKDAERMNELLQRKKATLQDRFSRVIRSLDPQRFTEPDLMTLRQQFKHELSQIVGDEETVKEVLLPAMTRYNEN